jgi:hypothetical protein
MEQPLNHRPIPNAQVPKNRLYGTRRTEKALMPIRPFLAGQAFGPEVIREMSLALESACETLQLRLTDDANTRFVASKIIELAQRGVRDAPTLTAMTLKELNITDSINRISPAFVKGRGGGHPVESSHCLHRSAIRRASSRVSSLAADRRPAHPQNRHRRALVRRGRARRSRRLFLRLTKAAGSGVVA